MLASKQPHWGAWLNAVPLSNLGFHLDDETLRISVALCIRALVSEPHVCRCNRVVDRLGHHGLSCHYSAGAKFWNIAGLSAVATLRDARLRGDYETL